MPQLLCQVLADCWPSSNLCIQVTGSKDRIVISVASRTDAGVHARGQAATFSCTDPKFELQLAALNVTLERNIAVTDILPVSEGFNVAKSLGKLYCYRFADADSPLLVHLLQLNICLMRTEPWVSTAHFQNPAALSQLHLVVCPFALHDCISAAKTA